MKKYFITFATSNWVKAKQRFDHDIHLIQSNYKLFDYYNFFTEKDLNAEYLNIFQQHFRDQGRAYWSWKPYIIRQTLQKMQNGDILFYIDGGCSLPIANIRQWIADFNIFIGGLIHYDIGMPIGSGTTEAIAKKKILEYFNLQNDQYFKKFFPHYQAGLQLIKKTEKIENLIHQWYCFFKNNYTACIKSDFYDKTGEDDCFYHNGADQAILHCLLYKNNINVMNIGKITSNYHMITRIRG